MKTPESNKGQCYENNQILYQTGNVISYQGYEQFKSRSKLSENKASLLTREQFNLGCEGPTAAFKERVKKKFGLCLFCTMIPGHSLFSSDLQTF